MFILYDRIMKVHNTQITNMDLFRDDKAINEGCSSPVRIGRIPLVFHKKNKNKQIRRFNKI